jgi:hypothetical protein
MIEVRGWRGLRARRSGTADGDHRGKIAVGGA